MWWLHLGATLPLWCCSAPWWIVTDLCVSSPPIWYPQRPAGVSPDTLSLLTDYPVHAKQQQMTQENKMFKTSHCPLTRVRVYCGAVRRAPSGRGARHPQGRGWCALSVPCSRRSGRGAGSQSVPWFPVVASLGRGGSGHCLADLRQTNSWPWHPHKSIDTWFTCATVHFISITSALY